MTIVHNLVSHPSRRGTICSDLASKRVFLQRVTVHFMERLRNIEDSRARSMFKSFGLDGAFLDRSAGDKP